MHQVWQTLKISGHTSGKVVATKITIQPNQYVSNTNNKFFLVVSFFLHPYDTANRVTMNLYPGTA